MESFDVIQIIDQLKIIYPPTDMQDKLNRWKSIVIQMDMDGKWNTKDFIRELNAELVIIRSILKRVEK
jgi:hypothetical protein